MKRSINITTRTALLAWLISIITLAIFTLAIIPQQNRAFEKNLQSKAFGTTVALRNFVSSAAVNEDFSSVIEHCTEMLKDDATIDFIVLTRNDGFTLIHERDSWRNTPLDAEWRPTERQPTGRIRTVPFFNRRVYHLAQPFDYSSISWGWIHIGLSLETYDQNITNLYRRTALLALTCTILGLAASIFYAKHLVRPILDLQSIVRRIADGDLTVRASTSQNNELGQLASSVNTMTEALLLRDRTLKQANETLEQRVTERTRELQTQITARERAHRELEEAQRRMMQLSREAGMAEVASGVLHNVGNVLTSINISANLLRDALANHPRLNLLKQTTDLMRAQGDRLPDFLAHDPRGKLVPPLIMELVDQIVANAANQTKETIHLIENIDHIKQIVATQQSYAKPSGIIQSIIPAELFDEAIRIAKASTHRHGITITREFANIPVIETDRHQVLQILVNLTTNAIQAVKPRPADQRHIAFLLTETNDHIHFTVSDTGVGIPLENLQKIFRHGFTTRKDGHGFGLHSGALAARSLGGRLHVHSDGIDRGTRFTLELPARHTTETKA